MREIKFRAWDKCNEKMVESRNILNIYMSRLNQEPYLIVYLKKWMNENREIKESDKSYTNEFKLMQYTGLQDKNGERIFEGDVLLSVDEELGNMYAEVVFEKGAFLIKEPGYDAELFLGEELGDFEIVGNVFENKELLEVE